MASQYKNIDFSFRRGTRQGVVNAPIKNGSFNFAVDTEELYVDIDDKRINISGVKFFDTEQEIRSLTAIAPAIYIASDTHKMLAYDPVNEQWFYLGGGQSGPVSASDVSYDNTLSLLKSDNAQEAIDEVYGKTWTGTLEEYNTLVEKDPDTTYFISNGGGSIISVIAKNVGYDNGTSLLRSNNVQSAIDELNEKIKSMQETINTLTSIIEKSNK